MITYPVFWSAGAGLALLTLGFINIRSELAILDWPDKLILCGPVFVAASLAVFGAEHLVLSHSVSQVVPDWMPAPLFWTYLVGLALLAAALSLALGKYVPLSAPLLAIMFLVFVLLIHIPGVVAHPRNRIYWIVLLRDIAFAGGALALAGHATQPSRLHRPYRRIFLGRICIAVPLIVFGFQQFLHPEFVLGVPFSKLSPLWIPFRLFWAYPVGTALVASGAALFLNVKPRLAAACIGLMMTLLTLLFYIPILVRTEGIPQGMEGVNYVADTLLFGGTALLLAMATTDDCRAEPSPSPPSLPSSTPSPTDARSQLKRRMPK
jgi:uncharacterized membrane protein YphA (DoxX/SURF4 family)